MEAHTTLKGTVSATKHEMLFSRFGINYNGISQRFKKGSVIVREIVAPESSDKGEKLEPPFDPFHQQCSKAKKNKLETTVEVLHCDIIGEEFWLPRRHLLEN